MDEHKQVKSLLPGDTVWIKDATRENKWEPVYEGPFVILQQHKSGTYSLLDSTGAILPRRVPISQIKLSDAGKNDTSSEEGGKDEHYIIEKVLYHRMSDGIYQYLVQWKGYGPEFNSWEPVECFDGLSTISSYWKKKLKNKKQQNINQSRKSSKTRKKKRA